MPDYKLSLKFNKSSKAEVVVSAKNPKELEQKINDNQFLKRHKERWTIDPPIKLTR